MLLIIVYCAQTHNQSVILLLYHKRNDPEPSIDTIVVDSVRNTYKTSVRRIYHERSEFNVHGI